MCNHEVELDLPMKSSILKFLVALGIFCYLIVLLVKNLHVRTEAARSVVTLQESVKTVGRERVGLQKEIDKAHTDEFIEQQARDTLNMVKEGETVLIMPEELPMVVEDEE